EVARLRTARILDVHRAIDLRRLSRGPPHRAAPTRRLVDQNAHGTPEPLLAPFLRDRALEVEHALEPLAPAARIDLPGHRRGRRVLLLRVRERTEVVEPDLLEQLEHLLELLLRLTGEPHDHGGPQRDIGNRIPQPRDALAD